MNTKEKGTDESDGGSRCSNLREEFRLRKLTLNHNKPSLFVTAEFVGSMVYVIWCVCWSLYFVSVLILDGTLYVDSTSADWFIYLTNWTYLFQSVTVIVNCILVSLHTFGPTGIKTAVEQPSMPWYMKLSWLLHNVSNTASILVTLLFYTLLTPDFGHQSTNKHLINSVYTVLNMLFYGQPVQLLHVYQPMIYMLMYGIFTLLYHATDNGPVYSVLDWSSPGFASLLSVLTVVVGIPIIHLFCFSLYTLRKFISVRYSYNKSQNVCAKPTDIEREITTRDVNLNEIGRQTNSSETSGRTKTPSLVHSEEQKFGTQFAS